MSIPCRLAVIVAACVTNAFVASATASDSIADFARIRGQGESVLQGLGLVIGLPGTGDIGQDLVVARPLAAMLEQLGNPVANLDELAQSQSVAVVMVTCIVPRTGSMTDDTLDVRVSAYNAAASLAGGELFLAPLVGPNPADPAIYAFAQGPVSLEDENTATSGVVRGGARMVRDIVTTPDIGGFFDLIIDPAYVGYQAVSYLAELIEDEYLLTDSPTADRIAVALGPRTIRVRVPEVERQNIPWSRAWWLGRLCPPWDGPEGCYWSA
ncbi:MAG: flagellar basal body P-ring protein FlgI [Planctomycetota bacterium]